MPKFPQVTARRLIRALEQLGFHKHRQRGASHLIMVHPDGRRTSIAVHPGDIPVGTLRGILRDIRITPEQLRETL
jgi:predicted RNA binding protein YcfA (HicA-like mRNA interferase family)